MENPETRVYPSVNQVEMNCFFQQPELKSYCDNVRVNVGPAPTNGDKQPTRSAKIHLTAYAPLGAPGLAK